MLVTIGNMLSLHTALLGKRSIVTETSYITSDEFHHLNKNKIKRRRQADKMV